MAIRNIKEKESGYDLLRQYQSVLEVTDFVYTTFIGYFHSHIAIWYTHTTCIYSFIGVCLFVQGKNTPFLHFSCFLLRRSVHTQNVLCLTVADCIRCSATPYALISEGVSPTMEPCYICRSSVWVYKFGHVLMCMCMCIE